MKMKKLFAGLIATGMVAAMGTSAFAASTIDGYSFTPSYEDGIAGVAADDAVALNKLYDGQMTVLIVKAEEVTDETTGEKSYQWPTTIDDNAILYIDQEEASDTLFDSMGVKDNTSKDETIILEAGTYMVRIGGEKLENGIYEGSFTVSYSSEEPDTPVIVYGELDGLEGVGIGDAIELLKYCATLRTFNDAELLAAELDAVEGVGIGDAIELLKYCATLIDKFPVEQ